jgi:hypothetical protein
MLLKQRRPPARVIDHDVKKNPPVPAMHRVRQFAKLLDARRPLIELHQRRINRREIQAGIRTAKPTEPRKGRRRGIDRQQLQNPAAQRVKNMRQFRDQITEFSRRRNRGITLRLQILQLRRQRRIRRHARRLRGAEHPRKSAINCIGRAIPARMHRDPGVRPIRPDLAAARIDQISLGAKKTNIRQRHLHRPFAVRLGQQRHIAPKSNRDRIFSRVRGDDFLAQAFGLAEIGAQKRPSTPRHCCGGGQTETHAVSDKAEEALARGGIHDQSVHHARECK